MFCPTCGESQPETGVNCSSCGAALPRLTPPPLPSFADEAGLLIPVNVEPFSVIAGYLGLFGFFLAGLPGVIAIACGVAGLKRLKQNPKRRGVSRAWTGIVLGFLQCVMLGWFIYLW